MEDLMSMNPEEIKERFSKLSAGQRRKINMLVALARKKQKIADNYWDKYKKTKDYRTLKNYVKFSNASRTLHEKAVRVAGIKW